MRSAERGMRNGCSERRIPNTEHPTPNPCAGFTLTELLVVVSIIVVVSLMTIPAMTPFFRGQRLRSGARIVQAAFVQARSVAIAHRAIYQIVFDTAQNTMTIQHAPNRYCYPLGHTDATDVCRYFGKSIELPDRVQFSESEPTISFTPSGSTTLITVEQIKIRDQAGTELILEVQPTTGTVRRSP